MVGFFGLSQLVESEADDRVLISLPGYQSELIHQLNSVCNASTFVLVLINGGSVAIPHLKQELDTILEVE